MSLKLINSGFLITTPMIGSSSLTFPSHAKNYICKHALGIAIHEKVFLVRPEAKNIPFGEKRKRERLKLAKKALIVM
jgi:hypothetical protein